MIRVHCHAPSCGCARGCEPVIPLRRQRKSEGWRQTNTQVRGFGGGPVVCRARGRRRHPEVRNSRSDGEPNGGNRDVRCSKWCNHHVEPPFDRDGRSADSETVFADRGTCRRINLDNENRSSGLVRTNGKSGCRARRAERTRAPGDEGCRDTPSPRAPGRTYRDSTAPPRALRPPPLLHSPDG